MGRTILVVDDETTLRETLVEALELEGYRAIPRPTGARRSRCSAPSGPTSSCST